MLRASSPPAIQSSWAASRRGAEYEPSDAENNSAKWVIHVHRGPNGGLKWARVKPWEKRKLRGFESGGATVMKLSNLEALGIKMVDTTMTHVAT
jgi:hypothetical protein